MKQIRDTETISREVTVLNALNRVGLVDEDSTLSNEDQVKEGFKRLTED